MTDVKIIPHKYKEILLQEEEKCLMCKMARSGGKKNAFLRAAKLGKNARLSLATAGNSKGFERKTFHWKNTNDNFRRAVQAGTSMLTTIPCLFQP